VPFRHPSVRIRAWRSSALRLLRGILVVGIVTALCYWAHLRDATTALLYLVAVVLQSLNGTFGEAAAISVLATACLDYFFTEPLFSFAVSGPLEAITLICLLGVSLVVTRIQAKSRAEANESARQRSNMESLYRVSRDLMGLSPPALSGPALLSAFLSAFDVLAVCLFDGATLECYCAGASRGDLESKTRQGFISGQAAAYPESEVMVQPLRAQNLLCGALGFEGLRDADAAAPALAALATAALDRVRAFRAATTAAAHVEAETLRTAILDALAHEFKTPLATILTAAGGLRIGGSTMPERAELAELIENEAARLGDLTTRLLRMARVDREELKPRLQATNPAELAGRSVSRYSKLWPEARISIREDGDVGDVHVDPELMGLAISQLVENACRYSHPDSGVVIELDGNARMAAITIWNDGPPIAENERVRIFERFYRGREARMTAAGSGLGLYVARKIARAHGGDLVLVDDSPGKVGFRLSVPFSTGEDFGDERKM